MIRQLGLVLLLACALGCKSKEQPPITDWPVHELQVIRSETAEEKKMNDEADNIVREWAQIGLIKNIDSKAHKVYVDPDRWAVSMALVKGHEDLIFLYCTNYILRRVKEDRFDLKIINDTTSLPIATRNVGRK